MCFAIDVQYSFKKGEVSRMAIRPVMKYHGAKWALSSWVLDHFPAHETYVEVFGGSAAVLLNKEPSKHEVYNDKNDVIVNLFRVIRDDEMRTQLIKLLTMTPYSRTEFLEARHHDENYDPVTSAHKLLIRAQMGFGSSGATSSYTGFKSYTSVKGAASIKNLWTNLPDNLIEVAIRLQGVMIENIDAHKLINSHDSLGTLFYLDPPYSASTRENTDTYGKFEYSDKEHELLLNLVLDCSGKFVISGYDNDLYNDVLKGWNRSLKSAAISSQKGSVVRTEVIWSSPNCQSHQLDFFD